MSEEVWGVIRADFARRWDAIAPIRRKPRAHGATQMTVAEKGGAKQNAISRILDSENDGLGPQVETLVRALIGLGVKPSDFFLSIEGRFPQPDEPPAWGAAANAAPTEPPRSPAQDAVDARRARLLKLGRLSEQIVHEALAIDAKKKRR